MTDREFDSRDGTLSVKDMQDWLRQEIRDSAKAHELRIKGATEFVTAYSEGKLTSEQAMEALLRHDLRWGEALYGASAAEGKTDEAILNAIDHRITGLTARRLAKRMIEQTGRVL